MIRQNTLIADDHDRDLERRVANYLVGRQVPSLRQIEVEADRGTVTLRGSVYSFHQKQLCLNCCRRVAGVLELIDEVEVVYAAPAQRQGSPRSVSLIEDRRRG
ncbi:MAG: BON domain-containing protein [Pirellulales bacterium]|nr:BON domain-containing protein [Pirellulales bacterium]